MVQLFFSLRFHSQIRRTRPKLLRDLESSITGAVEAFGGTVRNERRLINAVFNTGSLGFWLDILCMLQAVKTALEKASSELYGHVCILGRNINENDVPGLLRRLPWEFWGTGVWCAPEVKKALDPFVEFSESGQEKPDFPPGYVQLKAIREFAGAAEKTADNAEKIRLYLKQGRSRNTMILGQENSGIREGLYRYCAGCMKDFPVLKIRFSAGGGSEPAFNAVTAIGDSLDPDITKALEDEDTTELQNIGEILFTERLRDELSDFIVKRGERFFFLLLEAYRSAAAKQKIKPLLVLENIQNAAPPARHIIIGACLSLPPKEQVSVYGTCTSMEAVKPWEELFPRIVKFTPEKLPETALPDLPRPLWEMGYCSGLFCRYFPSFLLPQLFTEEGKNPAMIEKSLSILSRLRIAGYPGFTDQAERFLGKEGTEGVRRVVRNRLLDWVGSSRLRPCYPLLRALSALGAPASDNLVLDAVCGDIINGTFGSIERAVEDGSFAAVVGKEREAALLFIIKTQKALIHGGRDEIREAFKEPLAEAAFTDESGDTGYPEFRARIFTNTAACHLGLCDGPAAADAVKQAMLLTQNENWGRGLAQVYRLFSLASFVNNQISDAIDYFSFAVENAEKSEDPAELGISAYYAAGAHFIFGNLSKAQRLAARAREAAIASVLPGWADRSRFLEGRLRFEAGAYQEALDIFTCLETNHAGKQPQDFRQTLAAWKYRAGVYLHNNSGNTRHLGGLDAELFEIEAAYLAGEYLLTVELIDKLEKTELGERFIFVEQPDWRSGFCQCELLLFPLRDLWNRMLHTYRALALCHISGGETYNREEAIRNMRRIMRDELPDTEPNDAFYFYAYYQVLKRTGASEVDMSTAVSIAFKRLQRRASRIDDNETKRSFLSFHYWNSALAAVARDHKLI